MRRLLNWIDDRTDLRGIVHGALFEAIPGGARWRYVWGSTLVFTFVVQVLTGLVLWMFYSPGSQSAWESIYFLQRHVAGGALLRGIHHYTAQAMVVLLAIHLAMVVIDGAYKAPREFNFWIGLVLMLIVLGLALTGYLLPWDQKGYWATKVATRIASSAPQAGQDIQQFAVGGTDYGHYTLTRFFALHAGVLPASLVVLLAVHVALFRKHGITAYISKKKPRPDGYFWPEQVMRDAVACLVIFVMVWLLAHYFPPELGAPADGADNYAAARPEWYFLFLFQFLKFFPGETGEIIGAIVIPTLVLGFMFLMPLIGRSRLGHRVCVGAIGVLLVGAAVLTGMAFRDDYQARWPKQFPQVTSVLDEIDIDMRRNMAKSKYARLSEESKLAVYFGADANRLRDYDKKNEDHLKKVKAEIAADLEKQGSASKYTGLSSEGQFWVYFGADWPKMKAFLPELKSYRKFQASEEYLAAVAAAKENAERAQQLADQGIPPAGALSMLRNDPKTQGPRLFKQHCAACHDHSDAKGNGMVTLRPLEFSKEEEARPLDPKNAEGPRAAPTGAPNLYGFGSREWIAGLLDPKQIAQATFDEKTMQVLDAPYFGNTKHWSGDMVSAVRGKFKKMDLEKEKRRQKLIAALSAEAELKSQQKVDAELNNEATADVGPAPDDNRQTLIEFRTAALAHFECMECHRFHKTDNGGSAPDLTGYASRQWTIDFISNPKHTRFYGDNNDRMPAFAPNPKNPDFNRLTQRDIEMLVDWLRGEWYEPSQTPPSSAGTQPAIQPSAH